MIEEKRLKLNAMLSKLPVNVYYQPPETVKMSYPAIRYKLDTVNTKKADNCNYIKKNKYSITYMSRKPDDTVIETILDYPRCNLNQSYVKDNLYHYVFTLYL